jgi:putative transposase
MMPALRGGSRRSSPPAGGPEPALGPAQRDPGGSPRVHAELCWDGVRIGRKRVARLMREGGLAVARRRRVPRTTDSRHDDPVAPNLLDRNFVSERPDTVWLADIS